MDIIAQMRLKVNEVLDEKNLETLAKQSGFIIRKRKVLAKAFLEKMLLLRLSSANSSLDELVYEFDKSKTLITKQALHKKLTGSAVNFVQSVLEQLLKAMESRQRVQWEALPLVKQVKVVDSSEIRLHKSLKELCPQTRDQGAAIKLQALMNVMNNELLALEVRSGKEPDQSYKHYIAHIEAGDLLIGDLGYFCVESFKQIQAKGGHYLSRYFKQTAVYAAQDEKAIDLRQLLKRSKGARLDLSIRLGASKLACRLVAIKLPLEAYRKRIKTLIEKKRKDPRSKINVKDELHRWTLLVTDLPMSIEAENLWELYRMRWQIELLFKMMKTFLNLRKIAHSNPYRASIALYISLIAMTLLSFVVMTIADKEISLYKASKLFIKNSREFFARLNRKKTCAISWLRKILSRFAVKESRPERPSTKAYITELLCLS